MSEEQRHPWHTLDRTFGELHECLVGRTVGNTRDLNMLLGKLQAELYKVACRVLQGLNSRNPAEDAREAVQEWNVAMLSDAVVGYDACRPFYRYAYRILLNACYTIGRRTRRHHSVSLPGDLVGYKSNPTEQIERNEVRGVVRRAVGRLPRPVRRATIARYWTDESSQTASTRLGLTVGTFNRLTSLGRSTLRGELAQWPELCRPDATT